MCLCVCGLCVYAVCVYVFVCVVCVCLWFVCCVIGMFACGGSVCLCVCVSMCVCVSVCLWFVCLCIMNVFDLFTYVFVCCVLCYCFLCDVCCVVCCVCCVSQSLALSGGYTNATLDVVDVYNVTSGVWLPAGRLYNKTCNHLSYAYQNGTSVYVWCCIVQYLLCV